MNVWFLAALWVGLALVATLCAIWFKVSTALSEIVVGTVAQLIIGVLLGQSGLGSSTPWVTFLAGTGAIVLTFLAGAELDPTVFRVKWKEAVVVGLAGFVAPFLGCAAIARWVLGWEPGASWLAGVALSTTSVAVVYAVMLELGFNVTEYGKAILAACFVNDFGAVLALGLIFSPFTIRTVTFVVVSAVAFAVLPWLTPRFFRLYGGRVSERSEVHPLRALRARRPRALGGERARAARRRDRHGPRGHRGQGSFPRSPTPHAHVRAPDAVLLHPGRVVRLRPRPLGRAARVHRAVLREDGEQDRRRLSRRDALRLHPPGGHVLHADDVDRAHLRHDLRALRPEPWRHHRRAVFAPRRGGDRQRGHPDADRERVLHARSSAEQPGERACRARGRGRSIDDASLRRRGADHEPADPVVIAGAVDSMLRLNRAAAAAARDLAVTAATDITGFGILGHLLEMTEASGVGVVLDASRLPWLPGACDLAERGHWSGGMKRNRRHVDAVLGPRLLIDAGVPAVVESLLTESETSGGLLFAVRPERAADVAGTCRRHGADCWDIGEVLDERVIRVIERRL